METKQKRYLVWINPAANIDVFTSEGRCAPREVKTSDGRKYGDRCAVVAEADMGPVRERPDVLKWRELEAEKK